MTSPARRSILEVQTKGFLKSGVCGFLSLRLFGEAESPIAYPDTPKLTGQVMGSAPQLVRHHSALPGGTQSALPRHWHNRYRSWFAQYL